jgi:hypothetical protein
MQTILIYKSKNYSIYAKYEGCGISKYGLEGLDYRQQDDSDQDDYRKFVIPAVENVGAGVAIVFEIEQQLAAMQMIKDQHTDQDQFGQ